MQIFRDVDTIKTYLQEHRQNGNKIGFVPTMGTLHQGHLSLIQESTNDCDVTVCSVYVNPTQFNNAKDLETYPRQESEDLEKLKAAGCDAVFLPSNEVIYPNGMNTDHLLKFDFGILERQLEGEKRPGHFNGVGIVVSKLFHIVQPDNAYFGQKDLQQYLIVRKMVQDLSFGIKVKGCPTIREADGLAMSSRNLRLSEADRKVAPLLYQVISKVKDDIQAGVSVKEALENGEASLGADSAFTLEYLAVRETSRLLPIEKVEQGSDFAVLVAAHLGGVRLIDNILVEHN
ncbi:pantoate--beta-alanine ligase [Limibacter armeniacum]|uniref:pantoate--beta-alanine ligase n=1 Tax=Limibacter armeniacum TaxID=466084 RepID=UPI002FE6A3E8